VRTAAGILLVLALAPSASAETVARRTPAVGPVLAGDEVAWGEETGGGARVVRRTPGSQPQVVYELPAPTADKTRRGFMHIPAAFGASADAFAALVHTSTVVSEGSDYVSEVSELAAVGGPLPGPGTVLSGTVPERTGDGCVGTHRNASGVDVDGPRIAVAEQSWLCGSDEPPRRWIAVYGPTGRVDVPVDTSTDVSHVRLAGRYLAWIQGSGYRDDELVVHDLEGGAEVARIRARDIGGLGIEDAALQPDGTVAFTLGGRRGSRLGVRSLASPRVRVLDRRAASRGIAVAAGRVLYERSSRRGGSAVVLRKLGGGRPRTLARIPARRLRVGGLDLDASRATWAVARRHPSGTYEPAPGSRGRIVLRAR
jgi:hypothetical protein